MFQKVFSHRDIFRDRLFLPFVQSRLPRGLASKNICRWRSPGNRAFIPPLSSSFGLPSSEAEIPFGYSFLEKNMEKHIFSLNVSINQIKSQVQLMEITIGDPLGALRLWARPPGSGCHKNSQGGEIKWAGASLSQFSCTWKANKTKICWSKPGSK